MAGWSHERRTRVEAAFYEFLQRCYVNSKDAGRICLGEHLYDGQTAFITTVFDALEAGKHKIFVLKSRQLGISTIVRALCTFWLGIHRGLRGALVFDSAPHKESARRELVEMITNLPPSLKFPKPLGTGRGNRDSITFVNDSTMLFMSAGVKQSKTSGTLGRSEGLTLAHLSELCSYDNPEGLKSFEQSMSEVHPDRLYVYESTARGYNQWKEMWDDARADPTHCVALFLGWWSKPSQSIPREDPDFERYGSAPPSEAEAVRIKSVHEQYGHEITFEQLAWIRRKVDPSSQDEDSDSQEEDVVMLAEQAWTEQEAFQQTGSVFFGDKILTDQSNLHVSRKHTAYMYVAGDEFTSMRVLRAQNLKSVELKVWEDPEADATYVIGIDPAYGENEKNCRSSMQVFRCYADGIDQVAEYAWPMINTRQFAWAIASLLGWYGSLNSEVRYILELNGPGTAVFNELRSLKFQIDNDRGQRRELEDRGLVDVFKNVKTYIYTRPDSMGAGYNWHWLTTTRLKITIMERLRDFVSNGKLHVRSAALIDEMRSISRNEDSIGAENGMKDDRVLAAAMAAYYWDTKIKPGLMQQRRTREAEAARKRASIVDQAAMFHQNQLDAYFSQKQRVRHQSRAMEVRNRWRYR